MEIKVLDILQSESRAWKVEQTYQDDPLVQFPSQRLSQHVVRNKKDNVIFPNMQKEKNILQKRSSNIKVIKIKIKYILLRLNNTICEHINTNIIYTILNRREFSLVRLSSNSTRS